MKIILVALMIINGLAETAIAESKKAKSLDGYAVTDSTKIDFESASIDGQMKAPTGFFLQGRNPSSLSQMVKLRSEFKKEMKSSQSAVRALVK
jgi:hypothetical protein